MTTDIGKFAHFGAKHLARAVEIALADPIGADVLTSAGKGRTIAATHKALDRALAKMEDSLHRDYALQHLRQARECWWAIAMTEEGPACRYARRAAARMGLSESDAEQEATLGLLEAARRFDPARGVPFRAYALWWVRKKVREWIFDNSAITKRPRSWLAAILNSYRPEMDRYTVQEQAEILGVDPQQLTSSSEAATVSLSDPAFQDDPEGSTREEYLEQLGYDPTGEIERRIELTQRLAKLPPEVRDMLAIYLDQGSHARIAEVLKISRSGAHTAVIRAKLALALAGTDPPPGGHPLWAEVSVLLEICPGLTADRAAAYLVRGGGPIRAAIAKAEAAGKIYRDGARYYATKTHPRPPRGPVLEAA